MKKDYYFGGLMSGMALCVVIMVSVSLCVAGPQSLNPQPTINLPCKVVKVIDGDTVEVEFTIRARVRLIDCWAPETRTKDKHEKKLGLESKRNLQEIAAGKNGLVVIDLSSGSNRIDSIFSFGRILGEVFIDGKSTSEQQVVGGFATKTKQPKKVKP